MEELADKVQNGQLYRHYTQLHKWDKNDKVTLITEDNWLKLLADIKKNGVVSVVKIGDDNTVYDGNHRLEAVKELIEKQGVQTSDNGIDLSYLPIQIFTPQTEAEKWRIALISHSDYRSWNREQLANYHPEFEELDLSLINIDFFDPSSPDFWNGKDTSDEDDSMQGSASSTPREVICPACQHRFTI